MNFLKHKLVPDWREAWKWLSVWLLGIQGLVIASLQVDPDWPARLAAYIPLEARSYLPPWLWYVLPVVSIGARLWRQRPKEPPK